MNLLRRLQTVRWPLTRAEGALALLVISARLTVFAYAGSPLPYYDQWLAEFNNLFVGIFVGQDFQALIDYHNEHWPVTTKLLSLLGYLLNGYWDVSFLIVCSALVRALTAIWTFRLIAATGHPGLRIALWLLCVAFFAFPSSGYNFLNGMQVSFFLADCALLWSLHTLTRWEKAWSGGVALVGGMAFGLASMGSALAIPAATLIAHLCQKRARPGFWPAWIITAGLALVYIMVAKNWQPTATLHPGMVWSAALHFWLQILAWPTNLAVIGALVLGGAAFLLMQLRRSAWGGDAPLVTLVGLGVYAAVNAALIAAVRPPGSLHMRQWDTIGWIAFTVLGLLLLLSFEAKWSRTLLIITSAAALVYALGYGQIARTLTGPYFQAAHVTRGAAVIHYRELLLQGDLRAEAGRVESLLRKNDLSFFDDPLGRHNLHPIVLLNLVNTQRRPLALLAPEIIPTRPPSPLSRVLHGLIAYAWLLGVGGLLLGWIAFKPARPST